MLFMGLPSIDVLFILYAFEPQHSLCKKKKRQAEGTHDNEEEHLKAAQSKDSHSS